MLQKSFPHQSRFHHPMAYGNYMTEDNQPHTSRGEKHSQHTLHFKYSDGRTGFPHASNGQPQEGGRKTNQETPCSMCVYAAGQSGTCSSYKVFPFPSKPLHTNTAHTHKQNIREKLHQHSRVGCLTHSLIAQINISFSKLSHLLRVFFF